MNRITTIFNKNKKILSIYFTAGFPNLNDTVSIIETLADNGVDIIEIGIPFSDPLADGPTIQASSKMALDNGMTVSLLFEQLKNIRQKVSIPLVMMGYFNPIMQYGVENFCQKCAEIGIDGLIIPDLPLDIYTEKYKTLFEANGLTNIFLITPQTSEKRIKEIDSITKGFIYMVSSAGVTGSRQDFGNEQLTYFKRVSTLDLKSPLVVGFGISNAETFNQATLYTDGAIIGSAFIKFIEANPISEIKTFISSINNKS
ncbi:MAG: tryptophan synthase subunit alpha [Capnocytophaga sp.]|nr:tryptophan synthase subunit alpha [Capnocytophaga sp.]